MGDDRTMALGGTISGNSLERWKTDAPSPASPPGLAWWLGYFKNKRRGAERYSMGGRPAARRGGERSDRGLHRGFSARRIFRRPKLDKGGP